MSCTQRANTHSHTTLALLIKRVTCEIYTHTVCVYSEENDKNEKRLNKFLLTHIEFRHLITFTHTSSVSSSSSSADWRLIRCYIRLCRPQYREEATESERNRNLSYVQCNNQIRLCQRKEKCVHVFVSDVRVFICVHMCVCLTCDLYIPTNQQTATRNHIYIYL